MTRCTDCHLPSNDLAPSPNSDGLICLPCTERRCFEHGAAILAALEASKHQAQGISQ